MKRIFYFLPKFIRRFIVKAMEYAAFLSINHIGRKFNAEKQKSSNKKNILIYHISALSFGGTEKNLQMIAKYLNKDKYNVFLMHSTGTEKNRLPYLKDSDIEIINFSKTTTDKRWPYFIKNMKPELEKVVYEKQIDCIVTATPGQTIYPIINIRKIPIVLINIFGSFTLQKNIKKHICISEEVKKLATRVVDEKETEVQYIPSEKPIWNKEKAKQIRERFNIKDSDLVFGRIGRSDDSIFDPIGILAFEIAVKTNPNIHYIIMSPADKAKEIVTTKKIPNVHWLEPSYAEEDVWAFHQAIDVLAHFRRDGESCGLNIIESMLVGNAILSHKSHIWNAHLEYLDSSFSRVSEIDDYECYAKNMIEFSAKHQKNELRDMGEKAKEKAEEFFLIQNAITRYEKWIEEAIS